MGLPQYGRRGHVTSFQLQFLVRRGERPWQAAGIYALYRRISGLRRQVRGSRGQRIRGIRSDLGLPVLDPVETNQPAPFLHL